LVEARDAQHPFFARGWLRSQWLPACWCSRSLLAISGGGPKGSTDVDRIDDIGNPAASGYERWLLVHHPVVDSPRLVIARIARLQQLARKRGRNPGNSLRNGRP
jgi:hypothetical protein